MEKVTESHHCRSRTGMKKEQRLKKNYFLESENLGSSRENNHEEISYGILKLSNFHMGFFLTLVHL